MIPFTWITIKLTELIYSIESGKRPKGGVKGIESGIPSIGAEHLNNIGGFKFEKIKYVPIEFAKSMTKGKIKTNDIIVVKDGATTGKTSFINIDFPYNWAVINEHVFQLRVHDLINSKYVFYHLWRNVGKDQILEDFRGAAQGGISKGFLNYVLIPLPPLNEQHRIVEKIEELFTKLDAAVTELKNVKKQLKRYRQSVLKSAFEGKLTEIEILWITLKDVCENFQYGSSKKSVSEGNVAVIRMGNIQNMRIDWNDLKYTIDDEEIDKYKLHINDVLFNRTNSPELVGKTCIYKGEQEAIFAGYLIRLNYNPEILNGDYLNYYMNSSVARNHGNIVKSFGVNQSNINATKLKSYPFPNCSIEEQQKIVEEIETRLSVADKIEEEIDKNLKRTEQLRQSILKKAFEGKLVPQDPNDEPAEKLLERIKKEKSK